MFERQYEDARVRLGPAVLDGCHDDSHVLRDAHLAQMRVNVQRAMGVCDDTQAKPGGQLLHEFPHTGDVADRRAPLLER